MKLITDIIPVKLIEALGWTLLHSLWQVALVALLTGIALILLRKHSAMVRYFVTVTGMATVLLMTVVTFLRFYTTPVSTTPEGHPTAQFAITLLQPNQSANAESVTGTVYSNFMQYFNQHFPLLVTMWALGVLVLLLRFMGGISFALRLKNYQVYPLNEDWQKRTAVLSQRLGISKTVALLESGLVKVPMTIGYFKPVILLPIGTVTGLAPSQVEAVLAHELAHIRRHDYLINLVQSLLEILLFYHPAIWWLSARVREEREHCCDDLAITLCGDSLTFARALTNLEERYAQIPVVALAATGTNGRLLTRIKRLLTQPKRTPTFAEGFIAAVVLIVGMAIVSVSASAKLNGSTPTANSSVSYAVSLRDNNDPLNQLSADERSASHLQWTDSTDRALDVIIVKDKKGNIVELYVDGRRIPNKEIKNYSQRIEEALATQKRSRYSDQPEEDVKRTLRRIERRGGNETWIISGDLDGVPPPPPPPAPVPGVVPEPGVPPVPPVPPSDDWNEARLNWEADKDMEKAWAETQKHMRESQAKLRDAERKMREQMNRVVQEDRERQREQLERQQEEVSRQRARFEAEMERHAERMKEHEAEMKVHEARMKKHEVLFKALEEQLVRDGFTQRDGDIEFEMKNGQLWINKQLQPDDVYRRYVQLLRDKDDDLFENKPGDQNFQFHIQRKK